MIPNKLPYHNLLQTGLSLEWDRQVCKLANLEIASIYFGGGTPSLFAPKGIEHLLKMVFNSGLKLSHSIEITIEANPEEVNSPFFSQIASLGINRLSLGVQSLDNRSLQTLERKHSAEKAISAIKQAKEAGIENISIDLMYDIPDQTLASWNYSLNQLSDLPITHLSLYNLTIEPHTVFYKKRNSLSLPPPEQSLQFLKLAISELEKIGLHRYEISAFAKQGFESQHNLGYWTGRPFLGFGPSACSYWDGMRFKNIPNLQRYVNKLQNNESWVEYCEKLPFPENEKELFVIALRLIKGSFLKKELKNILAPTLQKLEKEHLISIHNDIVQLTEKGLLFHDFVASELI